MGPCPTESVTGSMEKMSHRSDGQIWRRTAKRPVGSCCLLCQTRTEQFQPLVAFEFHCVSPPTANLERWSTLPESSVGRERLVRLSHNTADGISMSHSPPSGAVAHPLTVVRRDHMDYHTAELPECLRCLVVVRSPCHIAYYAIVSSLMSPSLFLSG